MFGVAEKLNIFTIIIHYLEICTSLTGKTQTTPHIPSTEMNEETISNSKFIKLWIERRKL
jgi:hypothetical protein